MTMIIMIGEMMNEQKKIRMKKVNDPVLSIMIIIDDNMKVETIKKNSIQVGFIELTIIIIE